MRKDDLLNKVPWLWVAIIILSMLIILQYLQILELRKALWHSFDGVAAEERTRALIHTRLVNEPGAPLTQ